MVWRTSYIIHLQRMDVLAACHWCVENIDPLQLISLQIVRLQSVLPIALGFSSYFKVLNLVDWKIIYFHPGSLGKWSILTNIFQMGWKHQLVFFCQTGCFPDKLPEDNQNWSPSNRKPSSWKPCHSLEHPSWKGSYKISSLPAQKLTSFQMELFQLNL